MNILELVRQEASKVYAVGEELNAFMNGFEKKAATVGSVEWLQPIEKFLAAHPKTVETLGATVGRTALGLGAGLLGMGIVKGITSTSSAITNYALKSKFESSLQLVRNNNKIVKGANQGKVEAYANTLFSFAPHVAADPNLLSSLLANAVHGEGIDAMTVKMVTDLEGRYRENIAPSAPLGIRI